MTNRRRTIVISIIYDSLSAYRHSELVLQECLKVKKGKVVIAPFSFALVTQFVITVHQNTLLRHVKLTPRTLFQTLQDMFEAQVWLG